MEKFKIVVDSSADLHTLPDIPFSSAPLKIITSEKEYVDDWTLDVQEMVDALLQYTGRSSTSCPSQKDWLKAFGDGEAIFCITISGTISGSFNAANAAKALYESAHPGRKVFVIDSLSTGPEMKLIVERIRDEILAGQSFDEICAGITAYCKQTGLLFVLESMKNLANNGRVSRIAAKAAGLLGIRIVGKASEKGELELLNKCRGQAKALDVTVLRMKEMGWRGGPVRISHCFNEAAAQKLRTLLLAEAPAAEIEVYRCGGLCSFYAEKGGMIVGFEKGPFRD